MRVGQEYKIRDLEQKLSMQEQNAMILKSTTSESVRLCKMERALKQWR